MKNTILSIFIILFFSGHFFAQGEKFLDKRDEIKKKQIEFIIGELQLTEKEKKGFIPIYKEYNNQRESLHRQKRKNMHNFHQNSLNMTNKDLIKLSDLLVDIDIKIAQSGKTYNEKFKSVLPPLKIILLHKAEHEFKKKLFKKIRHKDSGPK